MNSESQHEHLREVLQSFDDAMLVTHGRHGPHARPLAIAAVDGPTVVWFFASVDSPKVEEILTDAEVMVTFQGDRRYAVLLGKAQVVTDRAKIHHFWSASMKTWFPRGRSDPSIVLVRVRADYAELWDQTAARGVRYALEAARAYVEGKPPEPPPGSHAVLRPGVARP